MFIAQICTHVNNKFDKLPLIIDLALLSLELKVLNLSFNGLLSYFSKLLSLYICQLNNIDSHFLNLKLYKNKYTR